MDESKKLTVLENMLKKCVSVVNREGFFRALGGIVTVSYNGFPMKFATKEEVVAIVEPDDNVYLRIEDYDKSIYSSPRANGKKVFIVTSDLNDNYLVISTD